MPEADSNPSAFTRFRALLALLIALLIGAVVIIAMTWWVVGSAPRSQAVAEREGVSVSEFAALPDEDAYPAALAIAADGTVYTGSYQSGALWSISPEGAVSEIADSRERIGSITGLDLAPDGALYILDRLDALESKGAALWRYHAGHLSSIAQIPADPAIGLLLPDDIAVDSAGLIYISDRDPARVWRYSSGGENLGIFWRPPAGEAAAPTGLAYDARRKSILISDSAQDALYRVPASASELANAIDSTETLFKDRARKGYGFDGVDVTPGGEIYLALLAWNRAARLENGELQLLARDFRGASDLVYDATRHRLIVTNWNQFSLGFGTRPQLPFALDAVALEA
jgi:sugar lactone lactonase YvrE